MTHTYTHPYPYPRFIACTRIFFLHVYRSVYLARMRRYMQLAYLFHQYAKSSQYRRSYSRLYCETSGRGAPVFQLDELLTYNLFTAAGLLEDGMSLEEKRQICAFLLDSCTSAEHEAEQRKQQQQQEDAVIKTSIQDQNDENSTQKVRYAVTLVRGLVVAFDIVNESYPYWNFLNPQ